MVIRNEKEAQIERFRRRDAAVRLRKERDDARILSGKVCSECGKRGCIACLT